MTKYEWCTDFFNHRCSKDVLRTKKSVHKLLWNQILL
jgi:hypothetical protein